MTHGHTESWTANKRPAWLTRVQDKFRKQEMQERNLNLNYMTKLTNTANMIRCKRTASSLNLIGCLTPTVDKTNANRTNPRWNNIRHKHPPNPGSSTMKQNELSWLGNMTNRELNQWSSDGVAYHAFTHLIILVNQILGLHQGLHTESALLTHTDFYNKQVEYHLNAR